MCYSHLLEHVLCEVFLGTIQYDIQHMVVSCKHQHSLMFIEDDVLDRSCSILQLYDGG